MSTTPYDEDLTLWAEQQSRLLREAAALRRNEPIDWENVVEEIESLGISQETEVRSRLARIVEHLLKLQFSPAQRPRRGWMETVGQQRSDLQIVLDRSPSLRPRLPELLDDAARRAAKTTSQVLAGWGEADAARAVERHGGRYTLDEVLEGDYPGGVTDLPPDIGPRRRRR